MIGNMPTVAEQLRAAREARNLSINEVAEITKMRGDHIRALEEGNFDVFVAPVYIRGFTRTYGTLLKLDVPQLIKALEPRLPNAKVVVSTTTTDMFSVFVWWKIVHIQCGVRDRQGCRGSNGH